MNPTQPEAMDRLRRGFAEFGGSHDLGPDCATSSEIWDAVTGQAKPASVRRIVVHMAGCPLCAESWRAAREVAREGGCIPQPDDVAVHTPWLTWVLPVAAALVMVVAGWLALRAVDPLPGTPVTTAGRVSAPDVLPAAPAATVPEPPTVRAVPPAEAGPVPELHVDKAPLRLSTSLLLTMRGEGRNERFLDEFGKAIDPYKHDDFETAAGTLGALAERYPGVAEVAFYRGVSLLMAGRARDAIGPLSRSVELAGEDLAADARWYLLLAQAQVGERETALGSARELCGSIPSGELRRRACHAATVLASGGSR